MRDLAYLIQLYPEKTGKEILEIQNEDKRQMELKFQEANKEKLAIVEDINSNGGYFKGAFGTDQYYMYKILSCNFESDTIYCTVEQIVLFDSQNIKGTVGKDRINFEIYTDKFLKYEDFAIGENRIKEEEYNELKNYLFGVVPKFFKEEWEERQKEFGKK